MKKSILALSAIALCACGGTPGGSEQASSSAEEKAASIYFPTATGRDSGEGIDVFMDMGPVRLTYIYTGEGVHEEILRYEYNEDYISIDSLGRVTGKKEGSTRVYAITATQRIEFRVNVLTRMSYDCLPSLLEMQQLYAEHGSIKGGSLFCGDSFFDTRYNWTTFYSDFAGKDVFSSAIGTTRTEDWMYMCPELVTAFEPAKIFLHVGTNNINDEGDNGKIAAAKLIDLLQEFRYQVPEAKIYLFGIERTTNPSFSSSYAKSSEANSIVSSYLAKNPDLATYLDSPSVFEEDIDNYLLSDGLHPNANGYAAYVDMVEGLI